MCPNLMIHNSLNRKLSISNGQPNHNRTNRLHIIMHHTSIRNGILSKLISQQITYVQPSNILLKSTSCLLD